MMAKSLNIKTRLQLDSFYNLIFTQLLANKLLAKDKIIFSTFQSLPLKIINKFLKNLFF